MTIFFRRLGQAKKIGNFRRTHIVTDKDVEAPHRASLKTLALSLIAPNTDVAHQPVISPLGRDALKAGAAHNDLFDVDPRTTASPRAQVWREEATLRVHNGCPEKDAELL